ncbi:spap14e8.04 protein, partial [Rhizodiscina lignyota]
FAKQMYNEVMEQNRGKLLSEWDPRTKMVHRVLERLIPSSGLTDQRWEVHVINDPEPNAFVIPGGKVFVNTGILPICKNDDGLATVLGHEIAHNLAHHAAERLSQAGILSGVAFISWFMTGIDIGLFRLVGNYAFSLPGSRQQESEADYIGLMMMAQSCFNPDAAIGLWDRMDKAEKVKVPQFLSTHPSSHNRMDKMRE